MHFRDGTLPVDVAILNLSRDVYKRQFWGTTENAVRIQICSAIITYCLVAIVQHDMRLKRSTYEVLQILSISLTDKTPLRDLFEKDVYKRQGLVSVALSFTFSDWVYITPI